MRLRLRLPRLHELMAASSISQNHWAIRLGLSRGHWSEIVNGKHPYVSAKTRTRMVETFAVPLDELFEIEPQAESWADNDFRRAIADRYLIDAEIGQGGMGAVYLARDTRHNRVVAVKVVSPEAVSGIGINQFHREIAAVAQLQHPNILALLDSGDAAGHPFYVMPYVRGGSLRSLMDARHRLAAADAAPIMRGIAAALDYAHGQGILHCDVKPENVLVHGDHAYVVDFGIARKLRSEALWQHGDTLDLSAGTPAYVSPEQASGDPDLDVRSDVYSLGCLVFEMLAGRPPFEGTTTQAVVSRRFVDAPPPLRDFAPELSGAVEVAVNRAMHLRRERRPDSAGAFVREFERARTGASRLLSGASLATSRTIARARRMAGRPGAHPLGGFVFGIVRDINHAWRGIRRAPGFALAVILTLGLALGANATMFGVVDRLLLRPPPNIARPEQVHRILVARWFDGHNGHAYASMSYPAFLDLKDRSRAFSGVAAIERADMSYGIGAEARPLSTTQTAGPYFDLLGVHPLIGRFYGEAESAVPDGSPVVVISSGLWRTLFQQDPGVLGRTMLLNNQSYTIVAVAPEGFTGTELGRTDVWLPLGAARSPDEGYQWADPVRGRGWQFLQTFARVKDGVSDEAAAEDATRAYHEGHADYREYEAKAVTRLAPLIAARDAENGSSEARVAAWLLGMAVIVLLIACANVANLVLARGMGRAGEIAVRRALGVNEGRLVRQFLFESLGLAGLGCVVGLGLAYAGAGAVRNVLLPNLSWDSSPVNGRVLAVTAGATLVAAVIAGLLPLLRGTRTNLAQSLHGASRSRVSHPRRLLTGLLVVQTTLSTVLLIGSGLFVRSLNRVQSLDLGFEPSRLLRVSLDLDHSGLNDVLKTAFYREAADRLARVPGVVGAGLSAGAPFLSNYAQPIRVPGVDSLPRLAGGGPYYFNVGGNAMQAMGIRVVRGRLLQPSDDRPGAEPVMVVSERMARSLWPNDDPLAKCIIVNDGPCSAVVGVAGELHRQGLREEPFMMYYMPLASDSTAVPSVLVVHTQGRPEAMVEPVRRALLELRSDLPYTDIAPYEDLISPEAQSWRLGATMFSVFGVLSLIMAAVGVYGVLSFSVTRRMPELGIRSALGASPGSVLRLIVLSGVAAAVAGVVLGTATAFVAGSRVEAMLFDTSARDPVVYAGVAACLMVVAVAAAYLPGRRASRVDPLLAMRAE